VQTIHRILDFVLPPRCPACAERVFDHDSFCGICWSSLSLITAPQCSSCGRPFDADIDEGAICGACLDSPPLYDIARSAFLYEGKGRQIILSLKNNRSFVGTRALSKLMMASLSNAYTDHHFDVIVPVPLHPFRLLTRRFNQSQLLAIALSKRMDIQMDAGLLVRTKHRPKQGKLKRKERGKNVRGVFRVPPKYKHKIEGRNILLVDDVITTGSTVNECAKILKEVGAKTVTVTTLARADRLIDR
jgi:ComF family protein